MKPGFEEIRARMVEEQLIPRGISDARVLDAFRKVPREKFVPQGYLDDAYSDYPLPIGDSQTISQPYMVALMTQCLALKGAEKVLEVGAGSGYQAAILAELAREVYSVERIAALADRARETLKKIGYKNCTIGVGDGTLGWEKHAAFNGIIVTAAAPSIPNSLMEQLSDKGRLVIPVGSEFSQVLTIAEKEGASFKVTEVCGCVFVPLIGKEGWAQ